MWKELSPGDKVLLNGQKAEVIRLHEVGELPYLRVYVEEEGVKSICAQHVDIEPARDGEQEGEDLFAHPDQLAADRFDLRAQATRLQLAHRRGQLLSISNSLVRLEPYQLACVNEVMRRLRQRVLIADDVGLGKTIEAGLILKELEARRRAGRVLFVVPAHLQKKWIREMRRFFDIELSVADRMWVEGERRRLGEQASIWNQEEQRLITSMSFIRQDEFAGAFEEPFWDVVVVDECHKASKKGESPSKTSRRVEQIAHQSDALILLSATPHTGKEDSFSSLISYIDPFRVSQERDLTREVVDEVMIRRGKDTIFDDEGNRIFPERKVQTVRVEMTEAEKRLYDGVTHYVRTVFNRSEVLKAPVVGLAMALMQKRLVSSVGAIRATLRRRLKGLLHHESVSLSAEANSYVAGEDLEEDDQIQAEQELEKLTVTGADDALEEEIDVLQQLVGMADRLAVDSKAHRVQSYIQHLLENEPDEKVLLFTEYRDTLEYLLSLLEDEPWYDEILVIHGDVDKDDRVQIEDEFNYGSSRLLFATDAASEGIDLQKRCHIMINYELPWNPNRLEQRIGRIHRYGQEREVKVLNFQFDGTRESEIFDLLQQKIDNIRSQVGATADVLGMIEDLGVEQLIMRSIKDEKPARVTQEELEDELEKREETLRDWYERSLIDCSTFDAESRAKIQEVVEESEEAFGSEQDLRTFVLRSLEELGGTAELVTSSIFRIKVPPAIADHVDANLSEKLITFDRDLAMEREELEYVSPDDALVVGLTRHILGRESDFGGKVGVKAVSSIDDRGITYNYRVRFEDGTGEVLREELLPLFVSPDTQDPRRDLGEEVLQRRSLQGRPSTSQLRALYEHEETLRTAAEAHLSRYIRRMQGKLQADRREQTRQELDNLDAYAESERGRLRQFIQEYKERQAGGEDMEIAIRSQRTRIRHLEERLDQRREHFRTKGRVIALEPELVNWCFTLPG